MKNDRLNWLQNLLKEISSGKYELQVSTSPKFEPPRTEYKGPQERGTNNYGYATSGEIAEIEG